MATTIDIALGCNIDYDDEWLQEDCHWKYKRFFNLTWTLNHGEVKDSSGKSLPDYSGLDLKMEGVKEQIDFYYYIGQPKEKVPTTGDSINPVTYGYTEIENITKKTSSSLLKDKVNSNKYNIDLYRKYTEYSCQLDLETLDFNNETSLTLLVRAKNSNGSLVEYYYEKEINSGFFWTAPEGLSSESISIKKYSSKKVSCSWAQPEVPDDQILSGYSVELRHKPKGSDTFSTVRNIKAERIQGSWWLTKAEENYESPEFTTDFIDLSTDDVTFISESKNSEGYLYGEDSTTVFFNPGDFGIAKNDNFEVVISPFTVYGSYISDGTKIFLPGSLLASEPVKSDSIKFTLGIMRIKTEDGWKEGQVWVKTAEGWKEAISVKTKAANGWKESI